MEWISVDEKYPDKDSTIVIATDGCFVAPMVYKRIIKNGKIINRFKHIKDILYSCGEVKYWLYMPKPPTID